EGNPDSPINRGRLCARGQAALQGLYNPDRVTHLLVRNANGTFKDIDWDGAIQRLVAKVREAQGEGIVFLTGAEQSTFGDLVNEWMKHIGGRHLSYEPFGFEALRAGNRMAFGTATLPSFDFANAKYLMSFGADFLDTWLSPVEFQNGFSQAHAFEGGRLAVAGGMATQGANGAATVAAVNILNYVVGSVGSLVKFGADLAIGSTNTFAELAALTSAMADGQVALLLVHGTNPAHSLPG